MWIKNAKVAGAPVETLLFWYEFQFSKLVTIPSELHIGLTRGPGYYFER
jgi:hypothetical protein